MMEQGKKYLLITSFGWGFVGTFAAIVGLNQVTMTDCHFVTRCGENTDWGQFVRKGPGTGCVVNKLGTTTINLDHCIWRVEYEHELPRTR